MRQSLRPATPKRSIRNTFICLVLLSSTTVAGTASADGFNDYGEAVAAQFLTGFNGVITAPADPVMSAVDPLPEYKKLPAAPVLGRFIGGFQGLILGAYRLGMGALDMVLSPIPIMILSPEPRYQPIPGFEWDE